MSKRQVRFRDEEPTDGHGGRRSLVRDDPFDPDPMYAELYASLPYATELEPWLGWCRRARGPVLYLGVGTGRLAVPLALAGIDLVGVDAHPGMLARVRERLPNKEFLLTTVEDLSLGRMFDLVMAPSNLVTTSARLRSAASHSQQRVAFEITNPLWLEAGTRPGLKVRKLEHSWAEFDISYPGGWTERVATALIWPNEIDSWVHEVGLRIEVICARDGRGDTTESSTLCVLCCIG